jgi:uncharacterized protein (DUF433 family)
MAVNAAKNLYYKFGVTLEEEPSVADNLYSKFGVIPEEEELVPQPGLQHELAQTYTDAEGNVHHVPKVPGTLGGTPIIQGITRARGFKKGALDILANLADYKPAKEGIGPGFLPLKALNIKDPIDAIGGLFDTPGEGRDWTDVGQSIRELAEDRYGITPGPDTFEAVKEAEGLAKIPAAAKYMVTQTPSMAAYTSGALAAPGLMMMSENQRLAVERAVNDNKISPEFSEYLATAPQAIINILLDRLPFLLSGGVFRRFTTGIGTEFVQGATEVPSTKLDTEAWLNVPLNQKIMETLESGAAEALAAGPLEAGGAFIDLSQRRQDAREGPPPGEVHERFDETRPIVGPPGPTTTVTGPPTPPLVGPPAPSPFVGPPGPTTTVTGPPTPPLVGPPAPIDEAVAVDAARGEQVGVDVGVDEQVEGAPLDATESVEGEAIEAREGEIRLTLDNEAYERTDNQWVNTETKDVADEQIAYALDRIPPRKPGYDPLQGGFANKFKDIISSITFGSDNAVAEYKKMIQSIIGSTGETAEEYDAKNKEFQLLDKKSPGQSVIITDDGTRIPIGEQLTITNKEGKKESSRETILNAVAALRARNSVFDKNFNDFINEIKRYHQHYGKLDKDWFGRDQLSIVVDLGGAGMTAAAEYNGREHKIILNVGQLMAGIGDAEVRALDETAIHELVHMKLFTLFEGRALENVRNTQEYRNLANVINTETFKNASREEKKKIIDQLEENRNQLLEDETLKLTDNFGRRLVKPMRTEVMRFLDARWAKGREVGDNPARFVANALNLISNTELYKKIQKAKNTKQIFNILSKSIESGERLVHIDKAETRTLQVGVGYHLIHELLAYESMTLDLLLEKGKVPTSKQKAFIDKFLRAAKQILNQMLGDVQVTRDDVAEFINTLFLETAGALPAGAIEETKISKIAEAQPEPAPLRGEAEVKRTPVSRMADEKIDLSKRRFVKQVAGAAAGAVVDPTILAEPAAAAVGKAAAWTGMPAITTVYRFAESILVQDEAREEGFEGEIIYDVVYDSSQPDRLEINRTIGQDDVETYYVEDIQDEDVLEPGQVSGELEMHDIDKIVSDMILSGKDVSGMPEMEWNVKNIHTVMPPHRDPFKEELADENRVMNEQDLELYTDADLRYLENVSGEEVRTLDSVSSKTAPGPRTDLEVAMEITRDRATGELRPVPEREMKPIPKAEPTAPVEKTTKVVDQIAKMVTENTEALEVIKAAIGVERDLAKAKTVEGEVIQAKRKREPGMAEEETMQDLRDMLAGSEERLERLQDVGRDEDIETIEEYEAEIEAYKKDIKELKEDIKDVGATLPRKEGEGPPIISRMVEAEKSAETLKQEYDELTAGIDDNHPAPRANGTTITIAEIAEVLTGGTGTKQSARQIWQRQSVEFWKAMLKLIYSPLAKAKFDRFQVTDFFNAWNEKVGKIKGSSWTYNEGNKALERFEEGFIFKVASDQVIQTTRERFVERFTNAATRPVWPWGHTPKTKEVERRKGLTKVQFFKDWIDGKDIPEGEQYRKQFASMKNKMDAWIEKFHPEFEGEVSVKEGRFSREWYKANENASFPYQIGKSKPTKKKFNLIGIAEKLRGTKGLGITDLYRVIRRLREPIATKNVHKAFNFVLTNVSSYDQIDDIFGSVITEDMFNEFKELKTKKKKEVFINERLGASISKINKSKKEWDRLKKHITYELDIPFDMDHIIDVGIAELIPELTAEGLLDEKTVDSLGYDHPFSWMLLPSVLNNLITPKNLKKYSETLSNLPEYKDKKITITLEKPTDLPIIEDYFTAYFDHIRNNTKDISLNELIIEAHGAAYEAVKDHRHVKPLNINWKKGITIPEKLSTQEIADLNLGTVKSELAKEGMARDPQAQRDFIKEFRNAIAGSADKNGNWSDSSNPMISRMVEPVPKEYEREAGWHQTGWNTFTSFMWSKPVETIRRYRYASPTMAKLADMIQRDISETKRVIKGGLDYIQRRGMALGQFRVALQAVLDDMTGRTGVVSKAVNDAVALYLIQGTPIKDPKVAKAAQEMKNILESIYTWSTELGSKTTKGFSLRPLDGGLLPRVWNIEELATTNGRKKFIKLLASIGIVDNLESDNEFEQTAATDAYNIALNSGGFISGDFTTTAYNQKSKKRRKFQVELFEKIEKEVSRAKLGTLLVNDIQAALPRFVDKAIEKTLYAELFGHYDEVLWEMKTQIEKEIREYNKLESTKRPVKSERAMQDINDMMAIIRHRFKMDSAWFNTRRYVQWFTNFTTVTLMPFVALASMPEFFTPVMLGSKNPIGFVNDFRSVSWYSALRAMNGMSKLFRGKQLDAMLYPKGKAARRAMFLKALGIIDIKSQGEAAAMRYIGPSFIRTGIAAQGPGARLGIKALYKLYGLGDPATGRFRARQVRSLMNMDTYFELVLLTTLTQMQQQMAANNLRRYTISLLKSISKGKGNTLQDMKILKDFGLTREEIDEAVRWYKAGHREFYDVPAEFKWDPSGMTLRFVDQVITRPNEATAAKAFRHPGFAPFLIFKSFITTFGNTFMVAMRDKVRFAEGEGTAKTRQQAKMVAGYLATIGAMYGMVMFAQSIRHMLQYDDDDDDYMDDVPEWKKFIALLNRTGLLTAPGSQLVDIFLPYKYGWWQRGGERAQDVILGPAYAQGEEIISLITDLANKGEVNLEKFLARIAPITKYEMFRDIVGAPSYYEKD